MLDKLASRKLIVAIGAMLTALGSGMTGAVDWPEVIAAVTAVAIGYFAAQGVVDAAEKIKPKGGS